MDDRLEALDPRERRLQDVLGAYLEFVDAGWAPEPAALKERYPDLAEDLEAFFVAQSHVAALAYPCPASAQKQGGDADVTRVNGRIERKPVGGYESLQWIGGGGMGDVFKAFQKSAGRWVALKKIKPGRFTSREVRRFLVEAQAAANLDHPNIVPIFDVGEQDGQPFYSMRLVENGTLQQHLPRFRESPRAAARLLAKVAHAVHHAHQFGIVHRDLKPANILLDAQEHPYVADFGLAKRLRNVPPGAPPERVELFAEKAPTAIERKTAAGEGEAPFAKTQALDASTGTEEPHTAAADAVQKTVTRAGSFVGTIGYAAPENAQIFGDATSTLADVYSLGAILYKLLTGTPPFEAKSPAEYIRKVNECPPTPPRTLNPATDEKLEAICMKCLAKDPAHRYANAECLALDLEAWLRGDLPEAWPLPWRMRAWRAVRPHLAIASAAAFVGFAAAAIFFVAYYFNPERVPRGLEQEARRHPVTLLGETGLPAWSRWNVGQGTAIISPQIDEPFSFTTLEHGRLELLPNAPGPHYRLSAEVRHDRAFEGLGTVGIYFAHVDRPAGEKTKRYWCDFTFADLGPLAGSYTGPDKEKRWSAAQLSMQRHSLPRGFSTFLTPSRELFLPAPRDPRRQVDWHQLVVEVGAEAVQSSWDAKALPALRRAELEKLERATFVGGAMVIPDYEFVPEGGLGLYVLKSKASFRNVIIESLP